MGQWVAGEDLASARRLQDLHDEKTDRAAAEDADALEHLRLGEANGVDRYAERLEHDGVQRVERFRQRDQLRFRRPDAFGHGAVERRRAGELDFGTQVRMAVATPLALAAGLGRIDSDQLAAPQAETLDVVAEVAAELMAGHERPTNSGRTDTAVFIVVQVAATNPDRGDIDQDLAFAPFPQIERRHTDIARATNEKGRAHRAAVCLGPSSSRHRFCTSAFPRTQLHDALVGWREKARHCLGA